VCVVQARIQELPLGGPIPSLHNIFRPTRQPCPRSYLAYATLISTFYYYFAAVMTSLRQPVGVWHEIVIQAHGDTSCLSMDSTTYAISHIISPELTIMRLLLLLEQLVSLPDMGL